MEIYTMMNFSVTFDDRCACTHQSFDEPFVDYDKLVSLLMKSSSRGFENIMCDYTLVSIAVVQMYDF